MERGALLRQEGLQSTGGMVALIPYRQDMHYTTLLYLNLGFNPGKITSLETKSDILHFPIWIHLCFRVIQFLQKNP